MRSLLILLSVFALAPAWADVPKAQEAEVSHLLSFVAGSGCSLIRNGSRHNAEEAVAHIRKKYDYFRDEIHSTEDFIAYSATRSTMSGKAYTVSCPGQPSVESAQWLLNELARYRQSR